MDPNVEAQYLFIWNSSRPYFTPGKFNPQTGAFSGIPAMAAISQPNSIYSYEYVSNDREEYFLLTIKDDAIFLRTVIDPSGQQKGMVWLEEKQDWMLYFAQPGPCAVYSSCGAFSWCAMGSVPMCSCLRGFSAQSPTEWSSGNYTGGCTRDVALPCSSSGGSSVPSMSRRHEEDRFYMISNVRLPDGSQTVQAASKSDCEVACLDTCSCLAYSYNSTCSFWHTDLMNLQEDPDSKGDSIFIRLPVSEIPRTKSTRGRTIGVVIAVSALALGVCLVAVSRLLRRRRRIKVLHNIGVNLIVFRNVDFKGTSFEFLPFRAGRRMCPGVEFGLATIELWLAQLLFCFDWKLPGAMAPEDLDMSETSISALSLFRKEPLRLIPSIHAPLDHKESIVHGVTDKREAKNEEDSSLDPVVYLLTAFFISFRPTNSWYMNDA
ncbi:G-type lectin S-receptor-like serine/threonine-protein kinase [Panicum miliaceum]|uniref:G-type lectin S-receptor-like serine/threonine-protein kinase n=1 Tax=Panicum miliaceum TaxID=4540 RepID=A0A3L6R910_PANMI|nr:G-type lectin S-receptor-like serine/threonine-protein kinase [Panicum miliaceum]